MTRLKRVFYDAQAMLDHYNNGHPIWLDVAARTYLICQLEHDRWYHMTDDHEAYAQGAQERKLLDRMLCMLGRYTPVEWHSDREGVVALLDCASKPARRDTSDGEPV